MWYGLTHMLKAWDVPSDTLYNMSTIIRGGDHDLSLRDMDDWPRQLGFPSIVCGRVTNVCQGYNKRSKNHGERSRRKIN